MTDPQAIRGHRFVCDECGYTNVRLDDEMPQAYCTECGTVYKP